MPSTRTLSQQTETRIAHERIERLKLIIEKYRRMIFGRKSEKLILKLEQLEFQLEELRRRRPRKPPAIAEGSFERFNKAVTKPHPDPASLSLKIFQREVVIHLARTRLLPRLQRSVCVSLAKMYPSNSSTYPGELQGNPSCAAEVRLRRLRPSCRSACSCQDRSSAGCQVRACWRMYSYPSMQTIFRSIVSQRSMPAKALRSRRSTLAGWVGAASDLLAPSGRRDQQACHRSPQDSCRRHADSGARARQR